MVFVNINSPAGDKIMAYLMISRAYNTRWRSHSNRASGCMKEGVEGSEIDTERARTQSTEWKTQWRASYSSDTIAFVLLLMGWSFQIYIISYLTFAHLPF